MKITTNVFGPDISIKEQSDLQLESPILRDVLSTLRDKPGGAWKRIIKEDLSLDKGCVILVNGRNIWSLQNLETKICNGDEITFTVLVAGGESPDAIPTEP